MSKPIFVVRFPGYWTQSQVDSSRSAIHQMKELNEDYHLIVNPQNTTIEKKVDEAIFGFKKYPKKLQQEIRDIEGSN